jgi:hypothetical protein
MPEPTHPPYESGALVTPRQLHKWLDINPQNGPLTRVGTYITLPVFSVSSSWNGYSDIVKSFNFVMANRISLTSVEAPVAPNYALFVSYHDATGVMTRYLIWGAVGAKVNQPQIPVYAGQALEKNFRFEVWNTSQGAVSNATAINFTTSKLGSVDYRYGVDYELKTSAAVTAFASSNLNIPITFPSISISANN